jgi:type IV conjugative transfer system coupling protein TraD
MAQRQPRTSVSNFARGSELWVHQARLVLVAIRNLLLASIVITLIFGSGYFYFVSSDLKLYALERNIAARLVVLMMFKNSTITLDINGKPTVTEAKLAIDLTEDLKRDSLRIGKNGFMIGALISLTFVIFASYYLFVYGRRKMTDDFLRGSSLVSGEELTSLLQGRDDCSPYLLAGVPMRAKSETLHTLIGGAQGTGKSQQFFVLMKQLRERGKRAIVYDPTGEFTQAFYREGKDILMNPLDSRSPNWNVWNEIEKDYHFDNMANGLIPDPAETDPFWAQAGRMVLKDVYRVLGREERKTNKDLYNAIAKNNLESLYALLAGTAGATYVDPKTERTGMSLKMTVQNQLESFRFLPDTGEPFSIRRWVHEDSDAWMFITARESMREALKPVLSLWIDSAIKAVLDLEPIHRERLWFFIDELPTLQKLDILKLALTNTRKYGLCVVLGVQDFSQLYETYGHDLAKTIISGCQTKLLLRVTDGAAAKLLADMMGQAEVDEKEETLSYGLDSQRDGVSVSARRSLRDIVLTSEILTLPDMHGYLVIPGDYPIAKVSYAYVPTPKIADGFMERAGFSVVFAKPGKPTSAAEGTHFTPIFDEPTSVVAGSAAEHTSESVAELVEVELIPDSDRPVHKRPTSPYGDL